MKKFFNKFLKKEKKDNKYEDKNIDVCSSSGFVIKNENNEWVKNRTSIKQKIEGQKSNVKTVGVSTQLGKNENKNLKVGKMEICSHCGFVLEDNKNYWTINRTRLLAEIAEKKAKEKADKKEREPKEKATKETDHLKEAMDKEKVRLEEEIKIMEKHRSTPDNKTIAQAVGIAIVKEVENQEKAKTPEEIAKELEKLHSVLHGLTYKKSNDN